MAAPVTLLWSRQDLRLADSPALKAAIKPFVTALALRRAHARRIGVAVKASGADAGVFPPSKRARVFLIELGWRGFAYDQLFRFPNTS
jgi:deoxyribodipyrimidine photolyase